MNRKTSQMIEALLGFPRALARLCASEGRLRYLRKRYPGVRFGEGVNADEHCTFGKAVLVHPNALLAHASIGDYSYIGSDCTVIHAELGRYCSVGPEVRIGLGRHPINGVISTFPGFYSANPPTIRYNEPTGYPEYATVRIGSDVWIGARAIIMDGLTIGSGAIIGAGAIVTKDVLPYEIVGGVPARRIRLRYTPDQIERLLKIAWWDRGEEFCRRHAKLFNDPEAFFRTIDL